MTTTVALQISSSVLQSGSCSRSPVRPQIPSNGAMWSLKIMRGVSSRRNRIHGRRSCSWRAQVRSPEKTQPQPGINGTAKEEAAAPGVIEEPTYGRQYFPLAAVVGQDAIKTALLLGAVDGGIGGIALSGKRGTAKTIMARGLHALLPPIEIISGSIANADVNCPEEWEAGLDDKLEHNHDGSIKVEVIKAPFVQIPPRVTEDHLLGSIDVEESIKTGMAVFQPGLLAEAHRGVLYVDEINLLDKGISNHLINVLNEGVNIVESGGVSFCHPCKPLLIATYNPDEGAVREDLLDRIAINLSVDNEMTFDDHVNAVEIATQFQERAKQVVGAVTSAAETLKIQVILGREWLKDVTISKEQIKYLVMGALRGDSQGNHAELIPVRVAKRFATLEGREDEDRKDKQEVQQQQELQFSPTKGRKSSKRFAVSQGRRVQTLAGYTAMIVMYTRMGQYKETEKMIEEMDFHEVLPDKSNWLARIAAYGQQGKVREAEKAFKGMQESGISPDTVAFHSLILLYGKARMYDRAYSTFRKMLGVGGTPDVYTFRSMVGACGKSGKLKDALQLFAEMRELKFCPSLQNFCTLINLYGKARNAGGIVRVIQEMKEIGCKPDAHTLDACLRAMERAGKLLKNLDKLLHSLKDAGWSADAASYSPLLNAYLKCQMHKEALETFRLMRKTNQVPKDGLCRELISQCKDAGKVEEAEYVFYEVEDLGITPSLETTCTMINTLGMIGKVQEAERLYNKLRSAGVKLDIVVYNVMISVYMRAGLTRDAARIFESVGQQPGVCPDSYTFHGMLRVYQKARLYQEAVEVYWKMVDSRIKLDEGLLNCVINCCGRALPLDETSRLFQAMLDAGFSPNNMTFNLMIDIYGKAGMRERACEVFNLSKEYGKVDSITYSILINFYGKQRDFANMEATAWEMQRRGLGRWVEAYNSIIDAYGKAGLLSQMEEVLERLHRAGCIGDVITYNILINVYGKKGTMQDLESVLEDMEEAGQKRDLWTYNTLIGIYGHAEVPSQVMSTFKEMQEVGIMPDRITYKNLVAAFEKSGNLWEAARWSLWMTQAGFSMDVGYSRG